jgi:PAS domain S-box-containing protein
MFMQKLMKFFERQSGAMSATYNLLTTKAADLGKRCGLKPAFTATAICLVLIGLVGWINLQPARGLSFEFVYLLLCALAGWAAGTRPALLCTLACATIMFFAETTVGGLPSIWVFTFNSAIRLAAFASISWLAARVGRLTRKQEHAIWRGTLRLHKEIEEHKETARLLQESVQLFQQLTESISDVFWVTDPEKTRVEYVSPEFENVWGESRLSLYRSPNTWLEGVHREDRERITRATFEKQVQGRYDEEYRVLRPDGSLRWVHERAFPIRNDDGSVYRIAGVAEDITERKRAERLLQTQRDMALALSSTSNLGYALEHILDVAMQLEGVDCGGIYLMNPQTEELHLEAHRALSPSFLKRITHYKADAIETRMAKAGRIEYLRRERIPRNQEVLWGSEGLRALVIAPIHHHGQVLGMLNLGSYRQDEIPPKSRVAIETICSQTVGTIARIRAQELLRQSEVSLRAIIHNAPVALFACDREGIITFEDGYALEATGLKAGAEVGRPVVEVYGNSPVAAETVRRALAGEEFSTVLHLGPVVLECHHAPTRDEHANLTGFLGVATNITERVHLEQQILEISDREQARIGQDLHDGLCQKLVSLAFDANSLEQKLAGRSAPEAGAVRQMGDILDDAITEARAISRGLFPVQLETDGLRLALEHLAAGVSSRLKIDCRLDCPRSVFVNDIALATHLYRIAQEAVNNAIKHSGARSIQIQLRTAGQRIELKVSDNGAGIPLPLGSTSGMGLHIMEYRARTIGGILNIELRPGGGTVVSCAVPQQSS